jgi:hypothetical protein
MATKKNDSTKTAGERIMSVLRKGPATTEELAKRIGLSVKDTYSRAYWLQTREKLLKSTGHGKTRTWSLSARGAKSVNPPAEAAG